MVTSVISEGSVLGQMQFDVFVNNVDIGDAVESTFGKFVDDSKLKGTVGILESRGALWRASTNGRNGMTET